MLPDGSGNVLVFYNTASATSPIDIYVQKIGSNESLKITDVTERDIAGYFWANDNQLLYVKAVECDENYQLFGVNKDGSEFKSYTALEGVKTRIIDDLPDIPNEVITDSFFNKKYYKKQCLQKNNKVLKIGKTKR